MKRLLILYSIISALAFSSQAQITEQHTQSVVRILKLGEPDKNGNVHGGTGSGFVISNDGLIMTNNHVIASETHAADHPFTYIVLQKVGDKLIAYRATFLAQDPNADLAVIRCPDLKAAPFQLLTTPPKVFDEVYSIGFPAVADEYLIYKGEQLNALEIGLVVDKMLKDKGVTTLDLTDQIKDSQLAKLLQSFVTPTSTTGKVEKMTEGSATGGSSVPLIQHSCDIRGGNSGGPLLNGGGQVLGVVGDAWVVPDGEHKGEQTNLAVRTVEAQKFLQASGINGCNITDKAWTPPAISKTNIVPIIIAASLAIAVALAALLLTLIKARRRTGMTALVESLRKKGISSGTQLLEVISGRGRPRSDGAPARSVVRPTPKGGNWKLDGRTSAGKTFQIPISESMFATNSSRLVLGRSRDLCDLVVEDETVSRQHAEIRKNGAGFLVADRNSSNGTAVNGVFNRKPFEPVPFKPGDTLTIGDVKLDFR